MPKPTKNQNQPQKKSTTHNTDGTQAEQDVARQLPSETTPGEERGERHSTGKTIARGGHPENRQGDKR